MEGIQISKVKSRGRRRQKIDLLAAIVSSQSGVKPNINRTRRCLRICKQSNKKHHESDKIHNKSKGGIKQVAIFKKRKDKKNLLEK